MYNLILVLATGVSTVGSYTNFDSCQAALTQFQKQNVPAACVQQPSVEQSLGQALSMMQNFIKSMDQK